MTLFHLGLGKLNVPIYDLVTLGAGFYIGYHEGKGINTSAATEYLTKYGPTAFTLAATPIMIKSMNAFTRGMNKKVAQKLENGDLNITLPDGSNKKYRDLSDKERQELTPRLVNGINYLDSRLQNPKYLKPTLINGLTAATETALGYFAGRLCSQIM